CSTCRRHSIAEPTCCARSNNGRHANVEGRERSMDMMQSPETAAFLGILATLAVGVVSPGPSFVLIARTAVATSRADGLAAAVGMGAGGLTFAVAALLGLHGVLLAVPSLYLVLKIAGGCYLAYLGFRIWTGAKKPLSVAQVAPGSRSTILK